MIDIVAVKRLIEKHRQVVYETGVVKSKNNANTLAMVSTGRSQRKSHISRGIAPKVGDQAILMRYKKAGTWVLIASYDPMGKP